MSTSNMLKRGADFLSDHRHASMAETVIYRRGNDSVSIKATVGRTNSQDQAISEFIVDNERIDFIVRSSDLILASAAITPEDGDEIEYDNGSGAVVYTVRRDETDQVYRPIDEFGGDLRIHTDRRGPA